jgi:hypothetical protein
MDRKMEGVTFLDPDQSRTAEKGKEKLLDFCGYWKQHWNAGYMPNLDINGKSLTPMDHMAQAFPGVENRPEEFVWLQASINTPAKSNVRTSVYFIKFFLTFLLRCGDSKERKITWGLFTVRKTCAQSLPERKRSLGERSQGKWQPALSKRLTQL